MRNSLVWVVDSKMPGFGFEGEFGGVGFIVRVGTLRILDYEGNSMDEGRVYLTVKF